jgi:uncharacterized membrane protein
MSEEIEECKKKVVKRRNYFTMAFATIIMLLVAGYLYGVTFAAIPKGNERVVDTILGFLLGSVISPIIIWAFRSSKAQIDKENAELEIQQLTGKGDQIND